MDVIDFLLCVLFKISNTCFETTNESQKKKMVDNQSNNEVIGFRSDSLGCCKVGMSYMTSNRDKGYLSNRSNRSNIACIELGSSMVRKRL